MSTPIKGGCACGAIRYEIAAEPIMAGHCQCRDCQHATGGGHASMIAFPKAAAKVSGSPKFHDVKADSGNTASRGFCPSCGSFVMARNSGMPDMVMIAAGSLDDPSVFKPQMVVYTRSAQPWDRMDPELPKFASLPEMKGPAPGQMSPARSQ